MNRFAPAFATSLRVLGISLIALSASACFSDELEDSANDLADAIGRGDTGGGSSTDDAASDAGGNPTLDVPVSNDTGGGTTDTGGGTETGDTCPEIITCINGLGGAPTQAQVQECIEAGSPTAQDQIVAIISCIQANCAEASDSEIGACQQEFCSEELTDCTGEEPPPTPSGEATCRETIDCFLTCRDQACANECVGDAASAAEANAAIEFYNCGVEECASATSAAGFITCAEEACTDESAACE